MQTAVTNQPATWQRVARVTEDFSTANTLATAGFTSAYQIAATPHASFIRQLSGPLGTAAQAETIYSRAQQIAGTTMAIFSNVRQALSFPPLRAIGDVRGPVQKFLEGNSLTGIPDWQGLFGSLDFCTCTDCRSLYSAAAYLVDLLQFLDSFGGLSVLLTRRPDLAYIKLNCENTNTLLPYVDLVNEILEGFVALKGTLNQSVAHNTSKDATADELSVSPEYTRDDAYNSYLNIAVYPPTLPFDRWLEAARTYLSFLGSSLYQVMVTCQTGADIAVYTAPLAALPPGITLPGYVIYNSGTLSTAGLLSANEQSYLLTLSSDASYQAAISSLYTASQADITKGTPSDIALACEYLKISQTECIILTGKHFSGQVPAAGSPFYYSLPQYYGYPADSSTWGRTLPLSRRFSR